MQLMNGSEGLRCGLDGKVKNGKIKDLYKKIKLLQKKNATAFIV